MRVRALRPQLGQACGMDRALLLGAAGMELNLTVAVVALSALAVAWSAWGARRRRPVGHVSWVPWHGVMFLGLLGVVFGAAHLLTLWRA